MASCDRVLLRSNERGLALARRVGPACYMPIFLYNAGWTARVSWRLWMVYGYLSIKADHRRVNGARRPRLPSSAWRWEMWNTNVHGTPADNSLSTRQSNWADNSRRPMSQGWSALADLQAPVV